MMGLIGGFCVMPAKPRPPARGLSPVRNPLRSMPAQNVPPAPVMTSTETSLRSSSSSSAPAMPCATAPLTAFLALGRLIVMTATPPSTSTRTSSDMLNASLRLETDAAVETDRFSVHVVVLDEHADEVGELGRGTEALGEGDRRRELLLPLVRRLALAVDGGVDDARADRVHPYADHGQVAGGGHGHADDAALGRGVGELAGLALERGHRGGVDDDAANLVGDGLALVLVEVRDHYLAAVRGEIADGGLAEAARPARHDGGNSVQIHSGTLPVIPNAVR